MAKNSTAQNTQNDHETTLAPSGEGEQPLTGEYIAPPADLTPGSVPVSELPAIEQTPAKRGRGRPRKNPAPPATPDAAAARAKVEAQTVVYLNDSIISAIAPDVAPADDALRAAYVEAVADYLQATGQSLPPWVALALVAGAYNARVLQAQSMRSRLARAWGWLKSRFAR